MFGTAGGWCVITGGAVERSELELIELPADLAAEVDAGSRPAGAGATRSTWPAVRRATTIPELLPLIAAHDDVDAVIYLGLGIQSNTARMEREGAYFPDHGLDRIVEYHERQDTRFAGGRRRRRNDDGQAGDHVHGAGVDRSRQRAPPRCGPPAGSAMRPAMRRSPRSNTSGATPATGPRGEHPRRAARGRRPATT
ncbi:MAG: hypothetical protein R2695_08415 [Acidimicrobiales bacterium]